MRFQLSFVAALILSTSFAQADVAKTGDLAAQLSGDDASFLLQKITQQTQKNIANAFECNAALDMAPASCTFQTLAEKMASMKPGTHCHPGIDFGPAQCDAAPTPANELFSAQDTNRLMHLAFEINQAFLTQEMKDYGMVKSDLVIKKVDCSTSPNCSIEMGYSGGAN